MTKKKRRLRRAHNRLRRLMRRQGFPKHTVWEDWMRDEKYDAKKMWQRITVRPTGVFWYGGGISVSQWVARRMPVSEIGGIYNSPLNYLYMGSYLLKDQYIQKNAS